MQSKKVLKLAKDENNNFWEVPYLPIDPHDVGREYEEVIRINSQSGKGGAAFIMENEFGFILPKAMQNDFGKLVKNNQIYLAQNFHANQIYDLFKNEYLNIKTPNLLKNYTIQSVQNVETDENIVNIQALISVSGKEMNISGVGNGPVDAFFNALHASNINGYSFISYDEHALGSGSNSKAATYIQIEYNGKRYFGVGVSANIDTASLNALFSAINRKG